MNKPAFFRAARLPVALFALILFALTMSTSWLAYSSSVVQMDFAEVVETAQLIFEGKVCAVESRQAPDGTIHTYVTLEIADILKGRYSGSAIELSFLGGTVGERRLQVTDLQIPSLGETGFYFVESLTTMQVNPLVGWAQGHYLIESRVDGSEVVTTSTHELIVTLDDVPQMAAPSTNSLSKGVAKGVVTQQANPLTQAMTVEDFRDSVVALVTQAQ